MARKLPVLIINSYAGSLTLAAHQEGHPVIGSYEDGGYGLEVQRANFPKLDYRATVAEWPARQDLSGTLVIAHPPCAAFSQQNNSPEKRGLDAPKFQQTKAVLEYALKNRAAALAVESVCGALEGARAVHDEFGARYRYDVYRLVQNAVSFGVPQWRERCWIVFLPKGGPGLRLPELPSVNGYTTVGDVLEARPDLTEDVEHLCDTGKSLELQRQVMRDLGKDGLRALRGELGPGTLQAILLKLFQRQGSTATRGATLAEVAYNWCVSINVTRHTNQMMTNLYRVLDKNRFAPVVLGTSWWGVDGRNLSRLEWQRLMGFSDDYEFPAGKARRHLRYYLSRGVCPPVARWVLQVLQVSVTGARCPGETLHAGQTADLRPSRAAVKADLEKSSRREAQG